MKASVFCRIIALAVLVIFTITSCNFYISPVPDVFSVPVGKGDIRYVFLDENYQPTIYDIGKMAMFVENNELAKDVLIVSEIYGNNIDNDVVVRVINGQNNSLVSFFFFRGQEFPYKMVMTMDGEDAVGIFSLYNPLQQTYSVEFTYETNETEAFTNLVLNNAIFSQFKWSDELTETQNTRAQCIVTTLALWTSMAIQIDDDFDVISRSLLKKILKKVLIVIAVVAIAVVVILAPPAAIVVAGTTITVSATTTPAIIAAGIAIAAIAVAALIDILDDKGHGTPPPATDRRPKIEITYADSGKKVPNRITPPEYIEPGGEIKYNITITDAGSDNDKRSIIPDLNSDFIFPHDSANKQISWEFPNAIFYELSVSGDSNDVVQITVKRSLVPGFFTDGIVQFAIRFKRDVIINDISGGVDFKIPNTSNQKEKDEAVFLLNFTVIKAP